MGEGNAVMSLHLDPCPPDGSGRHDWLLRAAQVCKRNGFRSETTFAWLHSEMVRTGAANTDDVRRAVAYIYQCPLQSQTPRIGTKPQFQPLNILGDHRDLNRLNEESDWKRAPQSAAQFVTAMLGGASFVCTGASPARVTTAPREIVTDSFLNGALLVVPNPMRGLLARNKTGASSNRCEALVDAKVYQIIEYDFGSLQDQAARIHHLRDLFHVPLKAVVFSGKKSLHAWFDVRALNSEQQMRFFSFAVQATGADPSHRSPVQLTRLPFAVRPDTGAVQSLVHFKL